MQVITLIAGGGKGGGGGVEKQQDALIHLLSSFFELIAADARCLLEIYAVLMTVEKV